MLSKLDLQLVIDTFDDPDLLYGLLLHGSCAKGTDDCASDIDLICVKRVGKIEKKQAWVLGRNVDLHYIRPALVRRAFIKPPVKNYNMILNSFRRGQVLADRGGVVGRLVEEARVIWDEGPPAFSPVLCARRMSFLIKGLQRSQRSIPRARTSAVFAELARILSDRVFREAITVYFQSNRLWASSLPETLEWLQCGNPDFHALCLQYLRSANLEERVAALEQVIGMMAAMDMKDSAKN
jgi:hypothetical protein